MERKKAIEIIKKNYPDSSFTMLREALGTLIPELKENEDERIRACIRMCLTDIDEQRFADLNTNLKECRDWLKKQGEHAKFRDSIQVGDKVTRNENGVLVNLSQLKRVAKKGEKQSEQKPQGKSALEAINEEKVDNANKVESRQEELTEFERAVKQVMEEAIECGDTRNLKADAEMLLSLVHKSAWSEDDELHIRELESLIKQVWTTAEHENDKDTIHKMSDLSFFLKTLNPQPKQEWSEEDKKIIDRIESEFLALHRGEYKNIDFNDVDSLSVLNWVRKIKSLCFYYRWKPSDEQIEFLSGAIKHYNSLGYPVSKLKELLEDLEKLKG